MRAERSAAAGAGPLCSPALAPAVLLFGQLTVFLPSTLHHHNEPFMSFSLGQSLVLLVPLGLVLVAAACAVVGAGHRAWQGWLVRLLGGLALAAWFNSAFLYQGRGLLDGTPLELMPTGPGAWLQAALYAALLGLGAWCAACRPRLARVLPLTLSALLALWSAWAVMVDPNRWQSPLDAQRLLQFSRERNVLVVLMDTFQSDFLSSILRDAPSLAERLDGFTFFADTVGVAPTTYLSIPGIHAGRVYQPGESIKGLYDQAVVKGSFTRALAYAGFEATLVNPILKRCPEAVVCLNQAVLSDYGHAWLATAAGLADLALLRMAPAQLAPWIYRRERWLLSAPWQVDATYNGRISSEVLQRLARSLSTEAGAPTLKMLHLVNTHAPARVDASCRPVPARDWTRPHATAQAACAMEQFVELLDRLKAAGVYDRTLVVLLADHGAGLSETQGGELRAAAAPLLLIKPEASRGRLRTALANGSLADVPATVCALARACVWPRGQSLFDEGGSGPRSHAFTSYKWRHEYWQRDSIASTQSWIVTGSPWALQAWSRPLPAGSPGRSGLEFAASDTDQPYEQGWSDFEADGLGHHWRWALGDAASLALTPPRGWGGRLQLGMFTHPGNPRQSMRVFANGQPVYAGWPDGMLQLQLPAALQQAEVLRLVFRFEQFNVPPGESRQLAAGFDFLRLQ